MNLNLSLLQTSWAGAPLAIWLGGGVLFIGILVAILVLCVRRIRIEWKSGKRQFVIETSNAAESKNPAKG